MSKEIGNDDEVIKSIQRSMDGEQIVNTLVEYSHLMVKNINERHDGNISLILLDHSKRLTDLYGWVLHIRQRFIKEEYGFPGDDDDPYLSQVCRVEISELEINEGNPKTTMYEYLDENGEIEMTGGFGISVDFTPKDYVEYLQMILTKGNARLTREQVSQYPKNME